MNDCELEWFLIKQQFERGNELQNTDDEDQRSNDVMDGLPSENSKNSKRLFGRSNFHSKTPFAAVNAQLKPF